MDRVLRRLEALLAVADAESTFILSGTGDVIEPDDGLVGIGSGGPYALAAARALCAHSELDAPQIAERVAADRGRHLRLHQRPDHGAHAVMGRHDRRSPRSRSPPSWTATSSASGKAKRAVAIALRNRWRRQNLPAGAARRGRARRTSS